MEENRISNIEIHLKFCSIDLIYPPTGIFVSICAGYICQCVSDVRTKDIMIQVNE